MQPMIATSSFVPYMHGELARMGLEANAALLNAKLLQIMDPHVQGARAIHDAHASLVREITAAAPNRFQINTAKKHFARAFLAVYPTLESTSFSLVRQAVANIAEEAGIDTDSADFV